jgi:hypothetical protein
MYVYVYISHTYIPLTPHPGKGSRGISDILPRRHVLPKLLSYEKYCRRTAPLPKKQ